MIINDLSQLTEAGESIERASFAFIDRQIGHHPFGSGQWEVVRRVIHTTGDFEFKDLVHMTPQAISHAVAAMRAGAPIITDVTMIAAGLNTRRLAHFGLTVHCHIHDEDVIAEARRLESTRARCAIDKALALGLVDHSIIAVGNAPTALIRLCELVESHKVRPKIIIGVPVGFIAAREAKERLSSLADDENGPAFITTSGFKGGSSVAVAILHALMKLASLEEA